MAAYMALHFRCLALAAALLGGAAVPSMAQAAPPAEPGGAPAARQPAQRDVREWLRYMHEASRRRSYVGTFVVLSSAGAMSSSRIWHACNADGQFERVESLTGTPRSTFRHNDHVVTIVPGEKTVRVEKRESLGMFPNLLQNSGTSIPDFYDARLAGEERVAGFDADVVDVVPKDAARFGYRIWSEKRTGLVVKLQTRDAHASVLEQAAFSELAIDAPIQIDQLQRMMNETSGYRVEKTAFVKTTPEREGWTVDAPLAAGFAPMDCYRRPAWSAGGTGAAPPPAAVGSGTLQCVFSDGLASVSVFIEPYDAARPVQESSQALGATQMLTRRLGAHWWFTAVGEVPAPTLALFAQRFVRMAK